MELIFGMLLSPMLFILCILLSFRRRRKIMKQNFEPCCNDKLAPYDFFVDFFVRQQTAINKAFASFLILFLLLNTLYIVVCGTATYNKELETTKSIAEYLHKSPEQAAKEACLLHYSVALFLEFIAVLLIAWTYIALFLTRKKTKERLNEIKSSLAEAKADFIAHRKNLFDSRTIWGYYIFGNRCVVVPTMGLIILYKEIRTTYTEIWRRKGIYKLIINRWFLAADSEEMLVQIEDLLQEKTKKR